MIIICVLLQFNIKFISLKLIQLLILADYYTPQVHVQCRHNKCIRFMGMKKSRAEAESACREMNQGRLAKYKGSGDEWIKVYLDRQMARERKNEIWIGAKLVNQAGTTERNSLH